MPETVNIICYRCNKSFRWIRKSFAMDQGDGTEIYSAMCPHCKKIILIRLVKGKTYSPDEIIKQ